MADVDSEQLLGVSEVAALAGVTRQTVVNWRRRDPAFPGPVAELSSGPVFDRTQIRNYLTIHRRKGTSLTNIISTINLKGGVGKTTLTIALADTLAGMGNHVLVIDLDPQTNATTMLIGEERWRELNDEHRTLFDLFNDALTNEPNRFDVQDMRQRNVSPVREARRRGRVDLLPSSLDLIRVQDYLGTVTTGQFFSMTPTMLLERGIRSIIDEYEWVLIDCPPNLGIITLNGLRISSGFIIPTIPDYMSTYGIPQILGRVAAFADEVGTNIEPLGIVISKFRANSTVHKTMVRQLTDDPNLPKVFQSKIPLATDIEQAADIDRTWGTLRQRWGYRGNYDRLEKLAKELIEEVEGAHASV